MVGHDVVDVHEPPTGRGEVRRQQRLLPTDPVTRVEAAHRRDMPTRRTTAPHATKPRIRGPGRPGSGASGLAAIAAQAGSSRSSGPTSTRAATSPSRGSASSRSAARASAPGAHHESSSQKATYGVADGADAGGARPAAPVSSGSAITSTVGCAREHRRGRAVARPVVDDDDPRPLGDRGEEAEGAQQLVAAIAGDDHHRDALVAALDRCGPVEHAPRPTRVGPGVSEPRRRQPAASSAWLTSASASAFCARGTVRTVQRSKPSSARSASAWSGRMSGCLTL